MPSYQISAMPGPISALASSQSSLNGTPSPSMSIAVQSVLQAVKAAAAMTIEKSLCMAAPRCPGTVEAYPNFGTLDGGAASITPTQL